ncbi:MAG: hypothetical protein IPM54_40555 [Polyangiaceae bacterium]|nr:hypothetical protein [Polyangiaceae bacterium]
MHRKINPHYEATGTQRTYAIVSASPRFPELRRLLPRRPPAARDCEACGGAGTERDYAFAYKPCGGLGGPTSLLLWMRSPRSGAEVNEDEPTTYRRHAERGAAFTRFPSARAA